MNFTSDSLSKFLNFLYQVSFCDFNKVTLSCCECGIAVYKDDVLLKIFKE